MRIFYIALSILVVGVGITPVALATNSADLTQRYRELQDTITVYKANVLAKHEEASTLQNHLDIVNQEILLNQAEMDQTAVALETTHIALQDLAEQLNDTRLQIDAKKVAIRNLLFNLYQHDNQSYLEIILTHTTLSDFADDAEYSTSINQQLAEALTELDNLRQTLKTQQQDFQETQHDLQEQQQDLELRQTELNGIKQYKEDLLSEVQDDEVKFQELIQGAQQEQAGFQRDRIDVRTWSFDQHDFKPNWPVIGRITTYFHDPTYLYRAVFEHNAIDIASPQGSPIRAADSGVVAVVKFSQTSDYAFIQIAHTDLYTTVYGHVSEVYVETGEVVEQGQIIAAVGGTRGGIGSGKYTTGPHLHFQVMYDGVAVDPLLFLP